MEITKITYYVRETDSLKGCFLGRCSVVFDDSIVIHNIKMFDGSKGKYIVMPEKSDLSVECNEHKDVFHPLSKEFFDYMSKMVLEGYKYYKGWGRFNYRPKS